MPISEIEVVLRLTLAAVLGGLLGLERKIHGKEAGLRTYSVVALGSALVMIVSLNIALMYQALSADPARIAAQVVSGIGFLGAGVIIRFSTESKEVIKGLTTAAGLWTSSGIGLACGLGMYFASIFTTILMLIIFIVLSNVNRMIENRQSKNPS